MPEVEFSYSEVSDEYKRLGYIYPKDDDFDEDQIQEAIAELQGYHLTEEVATLAGTEQSPEAIKKFAELAAVLKAKISVDYGSKLTIKRDTTPEQRRESAIAGLKSNLNEQFREAARRALRYKLPNHGVTTTDA